MAKFNFLMRDWKEQIDVKQLNEVLSSINESVRAFDMDTHSDDYCLVIHTPDINLTSAEWLTVFEGNRILASPETPDHAPKDAAYMEASEQEIKDYIKKVKEAEKEETEEDMARILNLKNAVLNGDAVLTDTYTKERIWEAIKADPIIDQISVAKLKELAKICGKDLQHVW